MDYIKRISEGNYKELSILTNNMKLFDQGFPDIASKIIKVCENTKESKVLYLLFLELSSVVDKSIETYNIDELKEIHRKFVHEENLSSADFYFRDERFYRNWFKKNIFEDYIQLMQKLFDCAYAIKLDNNDIYASEIIDAICKSPNVDLRTYALLHMENVECFLLDEDVDISRVAEEIILFKSNYERLPLDAKLLIELLETALLNFIIKINSNRDKKYIIYSSLFMYHCEITLPNYYFHMSNYKMIAYKIYEAILNKELEFKEGKEPIFYTSLCSNNPRRI